MLYETDDVLFTQKMVFQKLNKGNNASFKHNSFNPGGVYCIFCNKRFLRARSINQYTPAEAEAKMKNSLNIVFLDVRTKQEKKTGCHKRLTPYSPARTKSKNK